MRRKLSRSVRNLAPVVIPLVTRVALPIAMQTLRRGKAGADEVFDDAKDRLEKNLKRTRSDFDDVKEEAIARGAKLYDEARKHGTALLDLLAEKSVGVAQEWADSVRPRRRRRFGFGKVLALAAAVGVSLILVSRR